MQGFFVLSGYLVWASLERSPSLALYAEKRVRRLYPGYATVIVVCGLAALAVSPDARADPARRLRAISAGTSCSSISWSPSSRRVRDEPLHRGQRRAVDAQDRGDVLRRSCRCWHWLAGTAGRLRWALIVAIYVAAEAWRIGLEHLGTQGGEAISSSCRGSFPAR